MLTLSNLKPIRIAKGIGRPLVASLTDINVRRLKSLELREAEPWFDEAMLLHRTLNTSGILPLIASGDLTASQLDELGGLPLPNDPDIWKRGGRAPLSLALRLSLRFGLTDPCELAVSPLTRQLWDVLAANERHPEAPGWCPWCTADIVGGDPHWDTCLPQNLWAREPDHADMLRVPVLRPETRGRAEQGLPAHGLKPLRLDRELFQRNVADFLGVHANHYARIERGEVPLTRAHAERLAAAWEVDMAVLYAPSAPGPEEES